MANKQISDLQARTFDGDSIIAHDVENTDPSTMSQKPYLTGSATGHAVADFVGNGEIYTTDLDTVDKHINGAINELHAINGYSYDAYDDTATYAVGDLCIYNNALYKCTTAITTAEAWNVSHWTATSIADEINELNSGLTNTNNKIDYLRSKFYLGNYTTFTFTMPDVRDGGANFNHMTMVIGNNAFAILCCSYGQSTVSVTSLGSNTITATKSADSFDITVNFNDTSWGGIRVITLD